MSEFELDDLLDEDLLDHDNFNDQLKYEDDYIDDIWTPDNLDDDY
jgi:hypothetical protein